MVSRGSVHDPVAADETVDCSGMPCPEPLRKARHAIEALHAGQVLKLIVTEEGAPADVLDWAQHAGRQLVASERRGASYIYYIRRTE